MKNLTPARMVALFVLVGLTISVPIIGAKRSDVHMSFDPVHDTAAGASAALDPRRMIIFLPQ